MKYFHQQQLEVQQQLHVGVCDAAHASGKSSSEKSSSHRDERSEAVREIEVELGGTTVVLEGGTFESFNAIEDMARLGAAERWRTDSVRTTSTRRMCVELIPERQPAAMLPAKPHGSVVIEHHAGDDFAQGHFDETNVAAETAAFHSPGAGSMVVVVGSRAAFHSPGDDADVEAVADAGAGADAGVDGDAGGCVVEGAGCPSADRAAPAPRVDGTSCDVQNNHEDDPELSL